MQITRGIVELYGGPEDGLEVRVPAGALELRVPAGAVGVRAIYALEPASSRFVFVGYLEAD